MKVESPAPPVYLDASALVKLLVPEPESDALNRALVSVEDVVISDLALTQTASALGRRRREERLTPGETPRLYREAQKLAAACRRAEMTPPVHRRAERLLLTAPVVPLRTLDALHVALALEAGVATLMKYDPRLRDAASSQGLFVAAPHDESFYSNWELSSARALNTRRALEELGLASVRIAQVVGYADRKLRAPDDPMSSENRRISILIMKPENPGRKTSS